jgi:NAD(P)-dependent dehydrogenase (short-subunit alcohol dehydrogenase family)
MPNRVVYDLSGRVALVTGAGPNIGRVIAATLARAGATVLCNDVKADIAEAAARFAGEGGHNAHALAFDITDPDAVEQAIDAAARAHGTIDILVNNAGVTVPKSILTVSVEEWRLVTRVIQDGAFHCSRAVAKRLIAANKPGAIVNIASTTGHRGRKNAIAYATAKGGILNFTRALAIDLAPHRIRVNSVSPTKTGASVGVIETAGARNFDEIPLGRLGEPQDHANAVLFLVSDDASFITGIDLRVDGGTLATWGTRSQSDPTAGVRRA